MVAKRRTVVILGLVLRLRASKVSTVTGIGGRRGRETQNCRHFWNRHTRLASSRLKSVNSHWDRLWREERREDRREERRGRRGERREEIGEQRRERKEQGRERGEETGERRGERRGGRRGRGDKRGERKE